MRLNNDEALIISGEKVSFMTMTLGRKHTNSTIILHKCHSISVFTKHHFRFHDILEGKKDYYSMFWGPLKLEWNISVPSPFGKKRIELKVVLPDFLP